MKFAVILLVAMSLLLWQSPTLSADTATSPKDDLPVIQGQVVNNSGKAVPGAKVFALDFSEVGETRVVERLYADKKGRFTYRPKAEPTYNYYFFVASADRWSLGGSFFAAKQKEGPVKIVLWPEQLLKGKAVDEKGKPLQGAKVSLVSFWGDSRRGVPSAMSYAGADAFGTVVTDMQGKFQINHVPDPRKFDEFRLTVKASKAGCATITREYDKTKLTKGLRVTVPPGCVLEGTLYLPEKIATAPEGTPVAVQLELGGETDDHYTRVGKEGRFRLDDLAAGKARITLAPSAYKMRNGFPIFETRPWVLNPIENVTLAPGQPAKLDMVLAEGALIKGVVKNKTDDKPIPNAIVYAKDPGTNTYPNYISTDEKGEFFTRVAPGNIELQFMGVLKEGARMGGGTTISLDVAEGEEKTDVVLLVDPNAPARYSSEREIAPDFELKAGTYELAWDPKLDGSDMSITGEAKSGKAISSKLKRTPKFVSKKVHYGAQRLDGKDDDGLLVFALDESKGTGKGYDRLYLDKNRNWNLSDDKPIKMKNLKGDATAEIGKLMVQSRFGLPGTDEAGRSMQISLEIHEDEPGSMCVHLSRNGGWKGTIETAKGKTECVVVDTNLNGTYGEPTRYKETGKIEFDGDNIFIETSGSGKVSLEEWGSDCVTLYPVTKIGDKFYSITVSEDGDKVTVEPYSGPTGTLLVRGVDIQGLTASSSQLSVAGPPGQYSRSSEGKPVTLPAGAYRIQRCGLTVESKKGSLPIDCEVSLPAVVNAGEETSVDITGKLSLAVDPDKKKLTWKAGTTEGFEWVIKIGNSAKLTSIGSGSTAAPSVKFYNAKGKRLKTVTAGFT